MKPPTWSAPEPEACEHPFLELTFGTTLCLDAIHADYFINRDPNTNPETDPTHNPEPGPAPTRDLYPGQSPI